MALMLCPECGTEISTEAAACPKCGYRRVTPLSWLDRIIIGLGPVAGVLGLLLLAFVVYLTVRLFFS